MPKSFDLILRNGTVVNHDGRALRDIGVTGGRIAELGDLSKADAGETIDMSGLHVLPGVIDSQVHFREPGNEHKEDLETGSRAAVMGGVTAVFEMPNTNPLTIDCRGPLADKIARAHHRMACDFAFYHWRHQRQCQTTCPRAGAPSGLLRRQGVHGLLDGSLLVEDDDGVAAVLANITRRAAFHSEDEFRLRERVGEQVEGDPSSHPVWRDVRAAVMCTERLLGLAREAGKRVHVLHISTAEEMRLLAGHKDVASVEATPQHLTLAAPDAYDRLGTLAQMNPPLRDETNRAGIWWGLERGVVDVLGSDHAPHTLEEKAAAYPKSPSGMPGVQTLVPVMLDHVNAGRLTLERFVDLTSHGPGRIFQIAGKGRIAVGYDADFTVVDLKARRTITNDWSESRSGWTPFDGHEVTGWPVGTFIRGRRVMSDGEIVGPAGGEAVRFQEALG